MTTDPISTTRNRTGVAATPAPGQAMGDSRRFNVKGWLLWTAAFVSFPIAGIAAQAAAGRINDATAALAGGLVAGAVIGTGQWLAARRLLGDPLAWIAQLRRPWASACSPVPGRPATAPASVSWP
jgi:hypothetical protein